MTLTRRFDSRVPGAAVLALGLLLAGGRAAGADSRWSTSDGVRGVVELFTSQGCASCVPADRYLTTMATDAGLVVLSFHVDYWDYIGWPDPFGLADNTERQRNYAKAFGTGTVYTPQMVINGRGDVVGSRWADIEGALGADRLPSAGAGVRLTVTGDRLRISAHAPDSPGEGNAVLVLVTYDLRNRTAVERGENAGRTLENSHVVRDWRILSMLDGKPVETDMPIALLKSSDDEGARGCAAILQRVGADGVPGPILAAAALGL